MDRLVTSMVFCEAPVDFAYGGTPASKLAADSRSAGDASSKQAETRLVAASSDRRQAECAPAFDGLNCFETVVMPSHRSDSS